MLSNSRDIGFAVLVVLGLAASVYLVMAGVWILFVVGLVTPFWLMSIIAVLIYKKRRRKS